MANIFDNLKQLGQLKKQAAQFERLLREKTVEASSPRGEVKLKINGKMELLSIEINQEILKPESKALVEKLIKSTFSSAQKEVEKMIGSEMKAQMGGMNLPF
ncbi:MAG TPA: YbaB/EbfC family nucleoid-associated protein [bacterium]|nr:YbaB/EbfC family nucleoid-associated protein [bacterium]